MKLHILIPVVAIGIISITFFGCAKSTTPTPTTSAASYQQVNLVADTTGFGAARIDTKLANAWGIAILPSGQIWIATNHSGSAVIYDNNGSQVMAPVDIPLGSTRNGASPDGAVYNTTADFVIPGKGTSSIIFSTEDGILTAWNVSAGTSSIMVADRSSAGAVYKGLAIANDGGADFIYATDFFNGKIDVFDNSFNYVTTKPFVDPGIPAGYAPFNIVTIGGQLYVTYAKHLAPDNHDDESGPGHGFVDIYTPGGLLVKRFISQGQLNSPWGIAPAPAGFGQVANAILIGNFGDGSINVYDANGVYQGKLMNGSNPVSIPGLWAITFDYAASADHNLLYYTAGPGGEAHGLFGYLRKR